MAMSTPPVNFSAGAWVADAAKVLAEARAEQRLPIFIGGSGLYFKALTRGLSAVPPIPAEMRDAVRARLERDGVEALHAELARRDPVSAERLKPRDRTRIARALEVVEATGRALPDWHREGLPPLLPPGEFTALFLAPERDQLYARIDARFDAMLAAGALEEVAALAARKLDPLLPAMKAHGVPALIRHLQRRDHARAGRRNRPRRHPPLRQAAIHLVPAPIAGVRMGGAGSARVAEVGSWPGWSEAHPGSSRSPAPIALTSIRAASLAWLEPANSHSPNARNPATLLKIALSASFP